MMNSLKGQAQIYPLHYVCIRQTIAELYVCLLCGKTRNKNREELILLLQGLRMMENNEEKRLSIKV